MAWMMLRGSGRMPAGFLPPMKMRVLTSVFLFAFVVSARAMDIPRYNMDSLFFVSDTVVYCEEMDVKAKQVQQVMEMAGGHDNKWTETLTIVKCKVLQSFKGAMKPGEELTVQYADIYHRKEFGKQETLPAGRALLFLNKGEDGAWEVVDAKLVQGGKAMQFIQVSNPGPLMLVKQRAENIALEKGKSYGEAELLKDAAAALEKSTKLKEPVRAGDFQIIGD